MGLREKDWYLKSLPRVEGHWDFYPASVLVNYLLGPCPHEETTKVTNQTEKTITTQCLVCWWETDTKPLPTYEQFEEEIEG